MVKFYKEFPRAAALPGAVLPLVVGSFAVVFALALIGGLGVSGDEALGREELVSVWRSGAVWSTFPNLPSDWSAFRDPLPFAVVAAAFFLSALFVRGVFGGSWAGVGITVVAVSAVPLAAGTLAAIGFLPLPIEGWVAPMLVTFALGAVACAGCAVLHLMRPDRLPEPGDVQPMPRRPRRRGDSAA